MLKVFFKYDVSLIREVDVIEEKGEVLEHPLGEVEVDRRALEEANVENLGKLGKRGKPWRKQTWKTVSPTQPRFSICTWCKLFKISQLQSLTSQQC